MDLWAGTFNAVKDIVTIQDNDLTIIRANKAADEFFQASSGSLTGRHCYEVFSGTAEPCSNCPLLSTLGNGSDREDIIRHEKLNRVFRVNCSIIPAPDNETKYLVHIARDITKEIESIKILPESENRFAKVFRANPAPMAISEINSGRFINVNQRWIEMLDLAGQEIIGKTPSELGIWIDHLDRDHLVATLQREGHVIEQPITLTTGTGQARSVLWSAEVITIDGRELMLSLIKDVTESRLAEETRLIFLEILDNGGHIVVFKDPQLRYVMINRAHTALTGHTLADVAGKTDREVFAGLSTPEQIERYIANDRYALNLPAGQSLTVEEQVLAPDGSMRTYLTKKFPVYAQDGQLMGVATITSEITQLKLAEEEREKLQGQLVQARKMESVGRLAGGVAHDFNNMLAVIIGYTEIALEQVGSTHPLIAILREIEKAAEHSATLTRQLLAFTRKQTVVPEVLDLNQTVAGMLNMLRRLIREDIDLAWIPGKNLRPVKVDPSQIDQLLVNLCVNAKDAITGPGKIIIETGTAILDEAFCEGQSGVVPGEFVLLTVNDNGHGMDLGVVGKVFEPFFTTKDRGKGTGLGLATVYGIVKQNNGFIQVHSEPGMGTTIKIFLLPYSGKIEQKPKEGWMESAGPGGETILLVEDEPGVLEMTSAMLKLLGYKVLAAGGPGEAIRLALEGDEPIHLLITDVVMPEMNGKDLQKRVEEVRPGIKHLFMSGYANESLSKGRALEERTNFIGKPFSKKVLADKIRKVLTS